MAVEINLNSKRVNERLADEARRNIEENMEKLIARIEELEGMLEEKENGSKPSKIFTPTEFINWVGGNHNIDLRAEILINSGGTKEGEINFCCFRRKEIEQELGITPEKLLEVLEGMMSWRIEQDDEFKESCHILEGYVMDEDKDVVVKFGDCVTKVNNALYKTVGDILKAEEIDVDGLKAFIEEIVGGK